MKYLVKVLRPLYKGLNGQRSGLVLFAVSITPIVTCICIGVLQAKQEIKSWDHGVGIIVSVGTVPLHPNSDSDDIVESRVDISSSGEPDIHTTKTDWYAQVGDPIDYWSRDGRVSFNDKSIPNQPGGYLGLGVGIVLTIALFIFLIKFEKVVDHYNELIAEREDRLRAAPSSLQEFVALCREHGETVITLHEARELGACENGLRNFQVEYFTGKRRATIDELLPFIEGYNNYWDDVTKIVSGKLRIMGVIKSTYRYSAAIQPPDEHMKSTSRV